MTDTARMSTRSIIVYCFIGLFAVVFFVFLPSVANDFVDWDDYAFVLDNPNIKSITPTTLWWMLTTSYAGVWHPLTWFSHALDVSLWGMNPSPQRLESILLHCFNIVLFAWIALGLFALWERNNPQGHFFTLSARLVAAFGVALLFGVHPLRVESVVWIAERKDVLCAFFFLLSVSFYIRYFQAPAKSSWYAALVCHALALLAKPMAVTLPLVLLLIDYFPGRVLTRSTWTRQVMSKLPFFVLSAAAIAMNMYATSGRTVPLDYVPPIIRIMNASYAVWFYIRQSLWPGDLLPLYQMDRGLDYFSLPYVLSLAAIVAVTGAAIWRTTRRDPIWLAAWLYFLVTLTPALGFFMSYRHSMADRYTYLPTMGLWLLLTAGIAASLTRLSHGKWNRAAAPVAIALIAAFAFVYAQHTRSQIGVWKNSETLWSYILNRAEYVPDIAYFGMAQVLEQRGERAEALRYYKVAAQLTPKDVKYQTKYAVTLANAGEKEAAIDILRILEQMDQRDPAVQIGEGRIMFALSDWDAAVAHFSHALDTDPLNSPAAAFLVATYLKKGDIASAKRIYVSTKAKGVSFPFNLDSALSDAGSAASSLER